MLDFKSTRRLIDDAYKLTVLCLAAAHEIGYPNNNDSDRHERVAA